MAWVETISKRKADGLLKRVYDAALKRAGQVYNILKVQSQSPEALDACMQLYSATMRAERGISAPCFPGPNCSFFPCTLWILPG